MRLVLRIRWMLALACASLSFAAAAQPATVTLLEGPASVVRGVTRYALAEGVKLQPGDIIETGDKGIAQVEFADGVALAMSPGTRLLSVSAARGKSSAGDYYMTQGALKISRLKQGATFRFVTPYLTFQPAEGTAVLALGKGEASVFIENGDARITEPAPRGAAAAPLRLKGGEFYSRKSDQKGAVAPRPSQAFIASLPRVFLDPLPSRAARYKEREVQPKRVDDVSYADVETWLKAPPDIRRPLLQRFRPRASDPAFRAALIANLKFHPEWDPVLFPEKYKPKEPPGPAGAGRSQTAPAATK